MFKICEIAIRDLLEGFPEWKDMDGKIYGVSDPEFPEDHSIIFVKNTVAESAKQVKECIFVTGKEEELALQDAGIIFIRDEIANSEIHPRINLAVSSAFATTPESRPNDALLHARRNVDNLVRRVYDTLYSQLKRNETETNLSFLQSIADVPGYQGDKQDGKDLPHHVGQEGHRGDRQGVGGQQGGGQGVPAHTGGGGHRVLDAQRKKEPG